MIKFGFRESLLYPGLFVLFLAIRRIVKFFLEIYLLEKKLSYILVLIMFIFEIVIGFIFLHHRNRKEVSPITSEFLGIPLKQKANCLKRPDSNLKVVILILLASYFEMIGVISRRCLTLNSSSNKSNLYDEYHAKLRSSEIIIASLLCLFTLKIKIYRHHTFSLIIILICLVVIFITSFICEKDFYIYCILILVSSIARVFLDTIEKYLFTVDFVDIYKITIVEGVIDTFLTCFLFLFDEPNEELMNLVNNTIDNEDKPKNFIYWVGIFFLLVYGALSGLKNIYRRYTVKLYSPMTRALAESILDPFFIIYGYVDKNKDGSQEELISFIITLVCSFLMVFCSCVYNEIFVLYCFGLERNTHLYVLHTNSNLELTENNNKNSSLEEDLNSDI